MPPWLPDTAARAFAGRRRAVRFHLPHRWSVTQAAFRLSDGLRAQCWPAFHRGGRRSDRRSFKYMSFMCILIIIHIHSLCHALAFLANQRVTTGFLCKRSVTGEKMNIHLEKKLLEVMREIATEDADFIRNADHEALGSLAQGNTMLYSVSRRKEVLDTFTAEHNRHAEHVLAERGYDGDGHPVDHKKSLEACQAARRIRLWAYKPRASFRLNPRLLLLAGRYGKPN